MIRINRLLQTFGILLILSGGVFAQERVWKTFVSDDSGWSILAPGAMLPDAAALESPSTMGSYSYSDAKGFFSVIYRDTPKRRVLWGRKKSHYGNVRDNFIKTNKGQLIKDEEFSNGNLNGREIYVKIAEGDVMASESQIKTAYRVHRMRMFFDDRRFYIILAVLPEDLIDTPAINSYFNSFVVK